MKKDTQEFINHDDKLERGKRLIAIRTGLLKMSRYEFCQGSHISPPSLRGWEKAWANGLTSKGAQKFSERANELGVSCSAAWLMYGLGEAPTILGNFADHQTSPKIPITSDNQHIAREILIFKEIPNTIHTKVLDDSMLPFLEPNTYVGGIIISDTKQAIDKICIVTDLNENMYVRILKPGDSEGKYSMVCTNQETSAPIELKNLKIKNVAPIIWIRKTVTSETT